MASSVVSDNFETSTGAIPNMGGADVSTRLCSAWVNFNAIGTVAIRASYNVSSITDNGTGDYTVNFTTAMADANYALALVSNGYTSANNTAGLTVRGSSAGTVVDLKTTTAVRISNASTAVLDYVDNNLVAFSN
tara:strand:+ start:4437 stop:4838 length:402 start_codon:yes stop_codon:yes gene_type:complete